MNPGLNGFGGTKPLDDAAIAKSGDCGVGFEYNLKTLTNANASSL
jgi:hypothetical protein